MQTPGGGSGWERLFWLVFARSSNPIALLDEQRRFVQVNDSAIALVDRSREEVIGTSILEHVPPAERAEVIREWEGFARAGEYSGRRALLRADGSEVTIDIAARLALVDGRRLAVFTALAPSDGAPWSAGALLAPARERLSKREREVVTLIALGHETAELASELHISPETVRTHVRNAMTKLSVHTRAQLVAVVLCGERSLDLPRLEE
jgi:PAS domain S-box-containing protein